MKLKCIKYCSSINIAGSYSDSCEFKLGDSYDFHYYSPLKIYVTNDNTGREKFLDSETMKEHFERFLHFEETK